VGSIPAVPLSRRDPRQVIHIGPRVPLFTKLY